MKTGLGYSMQEDSEIFQNAPVLQCIVFIKVSNR